MVCIYVNLYMSKHCDAVLCISVSTIVLSLTLSLSASLHSRYFACVSGQWSDARISPQSCLILILTVNSVMILHVCESEYDQVL